jgi:hypothetical protein
MEYVITRDITKEEYPYLPQDFVVGDVVYECTKAAYGCVSNAGVSATLDPTGDYPFFELPRDACDW